VKRKMEGRSAGGLRCRKDCYESRRSGRNGRMLTSRGHHDYTNRGRDYAEGVTHAVQESQKRIYVSERSLRRIVRNGWKSMVEITDERLGVDGGAKPGKARDLFSFGRLKFRNHAFVDLWSDRRLAVIIPPS